MNLYERRAPVWVHAVTLVAVLALTAGMIYVGFVREPESPGHGFSGGWRIMIGGASALGLFMCGVSVYRLIFNPVYFAISDEGFFYSPGGVAPGLIRWADVVELKEETVLTGGNGPNAHSPVLSVVLRNPEEYIARYPKLFAPLLRLRATTNSSPVLISIADFRSDYPRVKALMEERIRAYSGVR